MKFSVRLLLTTFIVMGALLALPHVAAAQRNIDCVDTPEFPKFNFGWRILEGQIDSDVTHGTFLASDGTSMLNPLQSRAAAYLEYGSDVSVYSVKAKFYNGRLNNTGIFTTLEVKATDSVRGSSVVNGIGWWDAKIYLKSNLTSRLEVSVVRTGSERVAVAVEEICYITNPILDAGGTPSLTPTISATPTPTVGPGTPHPTFTPTPSNTPTPVPATITPGGPTLTNTSIPTLGSGTGSAGVIQTPREPPACDVPALCGDPIVVPGFGDIELPSPTAMTQAAFLPTSTFYASTGTPGTPGTPTTTGTSAPIENDVISYATQIAHVGNTVGEGGTGGAGFGLEGEDGFYVDIQNGGNQIGGYIGVLFGAARAVQSFFLGKTGSIVAFLLLLVGFYFVLKLLLWLVSVIKSLFTFFLQVISVVRSFFSI